MKELIDIGNKNQSPWGSRYMRCMMLTNKEICSQLWLFYNN